MNDKKKEEMKEKSMKEIEEKEVAEEIVDFDEIRKDKDDEGTSIEETIQKVDEILASADLEHKKEVEKSKDLQRKEEKQSEKKESKQPDEKQGIKQSNETAKQNEEKKQAKEEAVQKKEKEQAKELAAKKEKQETKQKEITDKKEKNIEKNKQETKLKPTKAEIANQTTKNAKQISSKPEPKAKKKKNILGIVAGSIAGVALTAYLAGFAYFSGHFYNNVAINGTNVSGMNKETAKQTLDNFYQDYVLTIDTIDGNEITIEGQEISANITLHDEFKKCFKQQQPYLWFLNMFNHYDFEIGADAAWDEKQLEDKYASLDILNKDNMVKPKDAYVGVKEGEFVIVEEVLGTTLDVDKFKEEVQDSLSKVMSALDLKEKGCYELPTLYAEDEELISELEQKQEFAKNKIKLKLDDLILEPGAKLYKAVLTKNGDKIEISRKKVEKYVKALATQYDTMGTEREFKTSWEDNVISVSGVAFGYIMNQSETTDALYNALAAKKSTTVEAVFDSKGFTLKGDNDIGDTYIEVNLSEQRVIAYVDGEEIVSGDCVSGKEAAGMGTTTGLFVIQGKQSPSILRGEKKPVTKTVTKKVNGKKVSVEETTYEYEYETPVSFWMPFNGGIGLHDATWRSSFGGSIYYNEGSHGCVNLPYDIAETIYNNFDIGTPVIVYFWN